MAHERNETETGGSRPPIRVEPSEGHTGSKVCAQCGEVKACSEFYRHARFADGLRTACKTRTNAENAAEVQRNRREVA